MQPCLDYHVYISVYQSISERFESKCMPHTGSSPGKQM